MRNRYQQRTTADEIADDFKTNAREAFDAGARYMGAARDWFLERAEEMQQRVFDQRSQARPEEDDFLTRAYRDAGRYWRGETAAAPEEPTMHGAEPAQRGRRRRGAHASSPMTDWDREQGIDEGRRSGRSGHARHGHAVHAYGYRGMGPRDYQRSDARIAEEINERLYESDAIDARDIAVQVNQGIVLMTGTVPHRWMKHLAEDLAERCRGVSDVENQVRVQQQDAPEHGAFAGARSTVSSANAEAASAAGTKATGKPADASSKRATHVHEPGETIGTGSRAAPTPPGSTPH